MVNYQEIAPVEAHPRLAEFFIIDVRADHEFRGPLGHVQHSALIPLFDLVERSREIPKGRPLLLICRSGKRSGRACEQLIELGLGPTVNLSGGMIAWNRAQLPVDASHPESLGELLVLATAWLAQVSQLTPCAAQDIVSGRLECAGGTFEQPTGAAVESILDFIEESLVSISPPDLDLSLASFRRWLAVL